jgi:hypothetical protein
MMERILLIGGAMLAVPVLFPGAVGVSWSAFAASNRDSRRRPEREVALKRQRMPGRPLAASSGLHALRPDSHRAETAPVDAPERIGASSGNDPLTDRPWPTHRAAPPGSAMAAYRFDLGGKNHLPSRIGRKPPSSSPTSSAMRSLSFSFIVLMRSALAEPIARLLISSGSSCRS